MPKSLVVDPKEMRKSGVLKIKDIPLNAYKNDPEKELKKYGKEGLKRIYYAMLTVREFETMLNSIKTQGAYQGIEYNHKGPAHLGIGQEAAYVGQCVHLGIDDFIFGSHRSHGEILSKCYSAVDKLSDEQLLEVMKTYMGGAALKVVEKGHTGSVKELAEDYVLYGTLAEIFAKENGFNKGLGGSMHAFFAPFGSMPNNAIVGGSGDICVGAALFKRVNRKPGIVIGNIGDASSGCGPVWEGIMFAAMDQYRNLWPKDIGGAPPVMFNFFNNFYGMGGQTVGETMGYQILARIGAGVNPENMHSERVDGYNPLAVADAVERKKKILLEGKGPVLLDTVTYRLSGHSPSDASSYRTKEELELWQQVDCIKEYGAYLIANNVMSDAEARNLQELVSAKIKKACERAVSMELSPRVEGEYIDRVMFSNQKIDRFDDRRPEVLLPKEENPRVQQLAKKERFALDAEGKPLPKTKVYAYRWTLRSHASPVLRRSDHGRIRGRKPRLGRSICSVSRPHRSASVP